MVSFVHFENPFGAWAFLSVIPLIILYLVRPRPKPIEIPSLMFFIKASGSKKLTSFLKQVTKDWLFLIQLLIILLLALTFLKPFSNYTQDISAQNTVLVIDVSASSQVVENGRTRLDIALSKAKDFLGSKNTVILAKSVPKIALQDASPSEVRRFFKTLSPTDSPSQIGEAIILAGETLKTKGRVVVFSDFINTGGQDPDIAKKVLESKGLTVEFVNTAKTKRNNIGIVDIEADNQETTVYIKNFMDSEVSVPVKVAGSVKQLTVPAKSIETYTFQTPSGISKIDLQFKDDFAADNVAYLSAPSKDKTKILLITNNESVYLSNALRASGDNLVEIAKPPVIPKGDFDVYIIDNVDMDEVLPGTFKDIKERADKGSQVIVHIQDDSNNINYEGLLPVKIKDKIDGGLVQVDQLNAFTKNIDFGSSNYLFKSEPLPDSLVVASINKIPVLVLKQDKASKFFYFGIPEDSEFKYSTSYPIFWTELIKYLTSKQDVKALNYRTGETLILDKEQVIQTPSKKIKRASLILDKAGIYQLEDKTIAVSLANERESNVNPEKQEGAKSIDYKLKPVKETRQFFWSPLLLILAIFFLFFE
ncbi:hypothetical protein DRJ22_05400, partial [Candidatus Woesearchaeota archaeon]